MSEVMKIVKSRNERSEFKVGLVLAFCLVAFSFFAVGLIYAQTFDTLVLFQLILVLGSVNGGVLIHLIKKYDATSST